MGSIKLHQLGAEMRFPTVFGFVPWRHHVKIVNKCKTVEEALFYIRKTIENGLTRSALIDILKADLYYTVGTAVTHRLAGLHNVHDEKILEEYARTL